MKTTFFKLIILLFVFIACSSSSDDDNPTDNPDNTICLSDQQIDQSRGACDQTLAFTPTYTEATSGRNRIITSNGIPSHKVGLFGGGQGSLNPNAISPQNES